MRTVSVIIPCYNEEGNIPKLIEKINNFSLQFKNSDFILVDNGSTDSTRKNIEEQLKLHKNKKISLVKLEKNLGYGGGILAGLKEAKGEILSWTHADLQTDITDISRAFDHLDREELIVKGHRKNRNIFDKIFSLGMQIFSSCVLGHYFSEVNAQPKMFSKKTFQKMLKHDPPEDFSLDLFLLFYAKKNKIQIKSFPVYFSKRVSGAAKGGGSLKGKLKLITRTVKYILKLKKEKSTL